jgi:hypothetical protein
MTETRLTGLVVKYGSLWDWEAKQKRDLGKDWPACLIAELQNGRVVLLPMTHSPPSADNLAIEVPHRIKLTLGLDDERSWIISSQCNFDVWPSPQLGVLPGGGSVYGRLPEQFLRQVLELFGQASQSKKLRIIRRDL